MHAIMYIHYMYIVYSAYTIHRKMGEVTLSVMSVYAHVPVLV